MEITGSGRLPNLSPFTKTTTEKIPGWGYEIGPNWKGTSKTSVPENEYSGGMFKLPPALIITNPVLLPSHLDRLHTPVLLPSSAWQRLMDAP